MGQSALERLSVLETKVDDLSTNFNSLDKKVDTLIDIVSRGNFNERINKLERKDSSLVKYIIPVVFTVIGAVITFLVIDFFKSPGI